MMLDIADSKAEPLPYWPRAQATTLRESPAQSHVSDPINLRTSCTAQAGDDAADARFHCV